MKWVTDAAALAEIAKAGSSAAQSVLHPTIQHSKEQRKWSKIRDENIPTGDVSSSCATTPFWTLSTMTHAFEQLFWCRCSHFWSLLISVVPINQNSWDNSAGIPGWVCAGRAWLQVPFLIVCLIHLWSLCQHKSIPYYTHLQFLITDTGLRCHSFNLRFNITRKRWRMSLSLTSISMFWITKLQNWKKSLVLPWFPVEPGKERIFWITDHSRKC